MLSTRAQNIRRMKSKCSKLIIATTLFAGLNSPGAPVLETNWPQFRGPGARGVASNTNLADHWSATENVAWKAEIPGHGWSSPIVWGEQVFLTTAVSSEE